MNIISNNCLGAYIYRDVLHSTYANPFMWCRIYPDSFIKLLSDFGNIDFKNIQMSNDDLRMFYYTIDNKIKIRWTHYLFNALYQKPTHIGINVYYGGVWEYILLKYINRLFRMSCSIDIVAIDDNPESEFYYDLERIIDICKVHSYKCFICTNRLTEHYQSNLMIVPREYNGNEFHPGTIVDKYRNQLYKLCNIH